MKDLFRLDGKVAVVIGGGGGIGKMLALGLASYGAKVGIASRNLAKLQDVARELSSNPDVKTDIKAFQVDATDERIVAKCVNEIISAFGTVDILVNSQGQNIKQPFDKFPIADWNTLFDNNVKSVMFCCREFGKVMLEKKRGKIINISSVAGFSGVPVPGNVGYCSTKGAVSQITRALAFEWAKVPIHVNALGPSIILTEMMHKAVPAEVLTKTVSLHPMGRLAQPEDLIGACVFLASEASDYMTGQIIYVDGGRSCVV